MLTKQTWLPKVIKMTGALRSVYPIVQKPYGKHVEDKHHSEKTTAEMTDEIQNRGLNESEDDYSDGGGGGTSGVQKVLMKISK